MTDFVQKFYDHMASNGMEPPSTNDIKPDNRRRNYRLPDDKKKPHGYYKLQVDGDFAYGFYGDYREDSCISFHSFSEANITPQQRAAYKKLAEKRRQEHEAERLKGQEEAAKRAKDKYSFTSEASPLHPYIKKKGLDHNVFEQSGDHLIIPMRDKDGKLWNVQTIDREGNKMFLSGGRKSGTFYEILGKTPSPIYICEGVATGWSVHAATGCHVYVAFDAGNLSHVTKAAVESNPNKEIIIAGDNDHETVVKGKAHNTGVLKAEAAAAPYKLQTIYPTFTEDDKGLSDFNDFHSKYGIEALKKLFEEGGADLTDAEKAVTGSRLQTATAPPPPEQESENDEWITQFALDGKGKIVSNSTLNATLVCLNDPALKGIYRFNEFSKNIIITRCPPWMDEDDFEVRKIQDCDYIPLECYLESAWGLRANKNKCADIINTVAMDKENRFNPATEYFDSLEWDGVKRIDTWLWDYVSDHSQPKDYVNLVGRKFLCGMAARALHAGIKFDTMLILEGKQYAGKSRLCRILATVNGEEYFLDDFRDIDNKDSLMKMQGKLIVEFPEISTLRKAEVNDLKAFITRQEDVFRVPYGRNVMTAKRQCVFMGTVNPEGAYFKDMTGNRRYWPLRCREYLDLEQIAKIVDQLHAEAAHAVKNGEQLWLTEEEYSLAQREQKSRTIDDMWLGEIEELVKKRDEISTDDICEALGISKDKRNNMVYSRLSQIMASLGFERSRFYSGTKQVRGWVKEGAMMQGVLGEDEEEIPWA